MSADDLRTQVEGLQDVVSPQDGYPAARRAFLHEEGEPGCAESPRTQGRAAEGRHGHRSFVEVTVSEPRPGAAALLQRSVVEGKRDATFVAPRSDGAGDVDRSRFEAIRRAGVSPDVPDVRGEVGVLRSRRKRREPSARAPDPDPEVVRGSFTRLR